MNEPIDTDAVRQQVAASIWTESNPLEVAIRATPVPSDTIRALCDEVDRLRALVAELEAVLRAARFVADHWRKAALQYENTRLMAHPLNLVLNALDGEADPTMLGIEPEAHDAFRAALGAPGGES